MEIWLIIVLMVVCLMMEAFFSGAEIGVVSADRLKLRHLAAKGNRGAQIAVEMLEKPEWLLSTTLVGTNIAIVTNTSLATLLAIQVLGPERSWMAILVVAPLIWVFGEIVPKSVFQQRADTLTPRVIYVLKAVSYLFYPLLLVFTTLTRLLARLFGGKGEHTPFTLKEEIELMLQMPASGGDIHPEEKTMIRRMFNFTETRVRDIAVPLIDVVSVERSATCGAVVRHAAESHHARLPVFSGRVDRVVGQLNALDMLGEEPDTPIAGFIQPVRFIPGAKGVEELLMTLRQEGDHMAVVVDEFGGAEGIITLEDILERVVGDIQDEYDMTEKQRQWVRKVEKNHYLVNARLDLASVREKLGLELPDGNYETMGGFLLEKFQDIPKVGQILEFQGVTFTVEKAGDKVIHEVRVKW